MSIGKKHTFWGLINDSEYGIIQIPKIQRDYVQGRNTPQVEFARHKLLDELAYVLSKNKMSINLNYVYGKTEKDCFVPIDGQQRLTTLFLIHLYSFSKEKRSTQLKFLKERFIYETRTTTERFLEQATQHLFEFFDNIDEYEDIQSFIKDAAWFSRNWLNDPSVSSFLTVLDDIHQRFNKIENISEMLMSDDCPITFMALPITNMGKASDLYIKMNSRGKPLSDFETFKSELFNYIDQNYTEKFTGFKNKVDNEWISMIWDNCENPQKTCDSVFMHFIHWIIVNRIMLHKDNYSKDAIISLIANKGFFNFTNYQFFLQDESILEDLHSTLGLFEYLYNTTEEECKNLLNVFCKKIRFPEWSDRVLLFAITKYSRTIVPDKWNTTSFGDWYRTIKNLVDNTAIDHEDRYISACLSIDNFNSTAIGDIISYFASGLEQKITFFDKKQLSEEIYKCCLFKENDSWKKSIIYAEKNKYFKQEIAFALKLAGANINDLSTVKTIDILEFDSVWKDVELLYNNDGLNVTEVLFRQALLTYGDYSIWANSSQTFFFEGGKGYFNWRRMLREESSFNVFKHLFYDIHGSVSDLKELEEILTKKISEFSNKDNEFIYYLIKYPQLFDYMRENRFYICTSKEQKNRTILYSRARLSAEYAEMHTYILKVIFADKINYQFGRGYLDEESSLAHISSVNGVEFYIGYDGKFVDEEGITLIDENNQEISTIEQAISYINFLIDQ